MSLTTTSTTAAVPPASAPALDDPLLVLPGNPPAADPVDAPALWQGFPAAAREGLAEAGVAWSDVMPGGGHWSWRLRRGTVLRLVALDAGLNASLVLYAAHDKLERYNMPDSLKAQHTAHYSRGHVLMSDMGRAMASIVQDSLGWHDPLGALMDTAWMQRRYGEQRYGEHRNAMHRSGKDGLLIEIGKHGLARRDLIAPVNLFSKVTVDEEGRFAFHAGHARAGDFVDLRLDMDVVLAISTAPHPLDPATTYPRRRLGLAAWQAGPAAADDVCRRFRGENARALRNTDLLYL